MPDNFFQTIHFKTGISLGLTDALTLSLCLVDTWDPMSTVVRWDISTAIFTIFKHASPDLFVNHMTLSFSQFNTCHRDHSLFGCVSWQELFFLPGKSVSAVTLTTVCIVCPLLSYLMGDSSRSISPYLHNLVPCCYGIRWRSEPPSRHGVLFQAHNLSLHHLHDLPSVWVLAAKPKRFLHGLPSDRLIFMHVHTVTSDTASDKVPQQRIWRIRVTTRLI